MEGNFEQGNKPEIEKDAIDKELETMFRKEDERIKKAIRLPSDKKIEKELRKLNENEKIAQKQRWEHKKFVERVLEVLEEYTGDGLAEMMPLKEVRGFLESLPEEKLNDKATEETLAVVVEMVDNGLGDEELHDFKDMLRNEDQHMRDIASGKQPEIDYEEN